MHERILPGIEENNFSFIKTIPEDPLVMIAQLGLDPTTHSRVISALVNIELAVESTSQTNQATFKIVNDELVAVKSTTEILLAKIENARSHLGIPAQMKVSSRSRHFGEPFMS